jgi:SAM-dependent methyltransferase
MDRNLEESAKLAEVDYYQKRTTHWNKVALQLDSWTGWGDYYHSRLTELYQFLVGSKQRIIEMGCAQGDLLASLEPSYGLGVDFSEEMLKRAKQRHPHLKFIGADAHHIDIEEKFDVIILSDLVNDSWDVQTLFEQLHQLTVPSTRIILNFYSHLWEQPLSLAEKLGLAKPNLLQN